jgi:four helix bundle suffix protein
MRDRKKHATDATKATDCGHPSPPSPPSREGFIPPHGGYEKLFSYPKTQIIYDATIRFCDRFINIKSRTHDQMVQAARSGNKNIAEGSRISGTSKESELKLTNVARASLEELLEDYRDFLRTHRLSEWPRDHRCTRRMQQLNRTSGASYETFRRGIEHPDPAICANVIIGLIKLTNFLLDRQIRSLEQTFLQQGGMRERMAEARRDARRRR